MKVKAALIFLILSGIHIFCQTGYLKPGCTVQDKDYSNRILSAINMYGSDIHNSDFSGSTMINCQLQHSDLYGGDFSRTNFAYADLSGITVMPGTKITRSNFDGANLELAHFHESQMDSCIFTSTTNLTKASFDSCNLRNAVFKEVNLQHTSFEYADLTNAVFINVTLDSTVFKHANLQGAYFYGAKEKQYSLFGNANLAGSNIFNSHFENSSFLSAQLMSARIENTLFKNANIMSADFSGSIIKNCDFSGADFNPAGALLLDGVDDIVTVESPGSFSSVTGAFSIEMAIVPQNQHKVTGIASFNHRSKSLKNLFEIYIDENFHLVFQYKISNEKIIHSVVSNDTLSGNTYNLIMITYNNGIVSFCVENKIIPVKSVYYSFSEDDFKGKNSFTQATYSSKPDETIETINSNLILGGFSGICPSADVIADSTCPAVAIMYYRFWPNAMDTDEKLSQFYPLQTNENGEKGYPFYYQIEDAPDVYTDNLLSNIFFFNCKDQFIKDTRNNSLVIYKGDTKGEDDRDPFYHIVNKNFENTLIENTTMFFGW